MGMGRLKKIIETIRTFFGLRMLFCIASGISLCACRPVYAEKVEVTITSIPIILPTATFTPRPTSSATLTITPSRTPVPSSTGTQTATPTATATPLPVDSLQIIRDENAKRLVRLGHIPAINPVGSYASGFAVSPDGHLLALDGGLSVRLWDIRSGNVVGELSPVNSSYAPGGAFAFSPDGKQLARVYRLNRIVIWQVESGAIVNELQGSEPGQAFSTLAYVTGSSHPNQNARIVAAGMVGGEPGLFFWDAVSGKSLAANPSGAHEVDHFIASPIGRLVVQAGRDGVLRFWNTSTGKRTAQQVIYACPDSLNGAAFARSGGLLALECDGDGGTAAQMRIFLYAPNYYQADNIQLVRKLESEQAGNGQMAFNRDGSLLAVVTGSPFSESPSRQVTVWSMYTNRPIITLYGFLKDIRQIEFSLDGRLLLTGLSDGSIDLWGMK